MQIDLGLGLEAELDGDEITLIDRVIDPKADNPIRLSLDQFDRFAAWVAQHRSKS